MCSSLIGAFLVFNFTRPINLFCATVHRSIQADNFCGFAEMVEPVAFENDAEYWQRCSWIGEVGNSMSSGI